MTRPLVILGFGHLGRALLDGAKGTREIWATTRREAFAPIIAEAGAKPIVLGDESLSDRLPRGADVVVTFPPDGSSDERLAAVVQRADPAGVAYISTTGVYGPNATLVDEHTAPDEDDERARPRLAAEKLWRAVGASVLRAPAIYGPTSGVHLRIARGDFRIVEGGNSYVSRIHVSDLARLAIAATNASFRGETFVVGDHEPATQATVARFVCERLGVPMPESVARGDAPASLRANRRVDGRYALARLGVNLSCPTYREGLAQCMAAAGLLSRVE